MEARGFFAADGFALIRDDVHFASTRAEKLARIGALHCDVFVDDLPEVLDDPDFPACVKRILFSETTEQEHENYSVCPTWHCVEQMVFG